MAIKKARASSFPKHLLSPLSVLLSSSPCHPKRVESTEDQRKKTNETTLSKCNM
jgi:hypothetical protein